MEEPGKAAKRNEYLEGVGCRLRQLRVRAHLTQTQLAQEIQITLDMVSRFESGKTVRIPVSLLEGLLGFCRGRGFDAAWLLGWTDTERPSARPTTSQAE